MAEVEPQPIAQDDPRLAVAAVLLDSYGDLIGKATVLSPDFAVTTAEVAKRGRAHVETAPPIAIGSLRLEFPQYSGSLGVNPLPTEVEAIDSEIGFGVLSFHGPLPLGILPLASAEVPASVTECHVLYSDESSRAFSQLSGRVGFNQGYRRGFTLHLEGSLPARWSVVLAGAPVFSGHRLVGIIDLETRFEVPIIGVLSVDGMARSEVTPIVRGLLPRVEPRPNEASNEELFARLSPSGREVLGRAEGIRRTLGKRQVHTEYLIAGLFPSWKSFFAREGLGEDDLREIVRSEFGDEIPLEYVTPDLIKMPPLSANTREALLRAAVYADGGASKGIWSKHLLYGALSVSGSKTVQKLKERGVRREDIARSDGPEEPVEEPTTLGAGEWFGRLSPSSQGALERANGMRLAMGLPEVHMEQLFVGLFEKLDGPTRRLLERAKIDQPTLFKIIHEVRDTEIPSTYTSASLNALPPLSSHVYVGLRAAAQRADERGSEYIRSRHLLYGALSVDECAMIKALQERGVRKEDIDRVVEPEGLAMTAPAPKVDSDLWCEEDRLGYEAYARTIASLITHKETKPPLTIGIKAPWGAGKTSLMKRVQHLLDGYARLSEESRVGILQELQPSEVTLRELLEGLTITKKPPGPPPVPSRENPYGLPTRITVWFNAWKYQTSEQIWAGMAHCIISQVTARMGVRDRELFWLRLHARRVKAEEVRKKVYGMVLRKLAPIALLVLTVCVIAFWIAAVLPVALPWWRYVIRGVPVIWGAYRMRKEWAEKLSEKAADTMRELVREPDYEGKMGYLHLVESDMREVLQLATERSVTPEKPNGDPLVVFVDDLDRCSPNKVAEVVEAINLFLCGDYPNCIFVLGMEPGMVAAALEVANKEVIQKAQEMGLVDKNALLGWRFMEKIVQLPVMIPPPTEIGRDRYVRSLTGQSDGELVLPIAGSVALDPVPIPRPVGHGSEEEAKVQSYMKKMGVAKSSSEAAKKSVDVVREAPGEELWAAREAGNRVYEQALTERDPAVAQFAGKVAQLVDGNPRQIKRYVNVFRFYSTLRHRLLLIGNEASTKLPSDEVLAKFVALSIRWPHAIDCLRVRVDGGDGKKVSLLKRLEAESRKLDREGPAANEEWVKFVGKAGLGLPSWAEERVFREFLADGESLCEKEGHGLW